MQVQLPPRVVAGAMAQGCVWIRAAGRRAAARGLAAGAGMDMANAAEASARETASCSARKTAGRQLVPLLRVGAGTARAVSGRRCGRQRCCRRCGRQRCCRACA
jgi:hypothetical protein